MEENTTLFVPQLDEPDFKQFPTLTEANEALKEFETARHKASIFKCVSQTSTGRGCGAYQTVGSSLYLQTHYYVQPHGCTGGDYNKQGEGQTKCTSCMKTIRLGWNPEIEKLKRYFSAVVDVYDE